MPVGEDDLVLYASWFCPYAQRAWIALEEKNVPFHYVEIDPYKRNLLGGKSPFLVKPEILSESQSRRNKDTADYRSKS